MKVTRLSAYNIQEGTPESLDTALYSKFKYGHRPTAIVFVKKMFQKFIETFNAEWLMENKQDVVITTSPYWYTPPAAHSLVAHFHYLLNEYLMEMGCMPIRYVKIHRSSAPVCDFSQLNSTERRINMKRDSLSVDPEALKGKILIVVEDSRITGAHEEKTIAFAEEIGVREIIFVYVVSVEDGVHDPDIEHRINHSAMTNLTMLYRLMSNPEHFAFNSRVCRFLLSWENLEELKTFFTHLSDQLLFIAYVSSINDGYCLVDTFKKGFEVLKEEVQSRGDLFIHSEETPIISLASSQH